MRPTPRRPLVVSIAVAFVYVTGLLSVLVGVLVLLSRYQVTGDDVLPVTLIGAAITLLGLLVVGIASGVARGSRLARVALTVFFGILVPLHLLAIVTSEWDAVAVVQVLLEVFTLVVLWLPPINRFFRDSPQIRPE